MRSIDLSSWPRRKHFEVYTAIDYPHFNLCAPVDLSRFMPVVAERSLPFTIALIYVLSKVANSTEHFRWRIRGQQVVEHAVVHPSCTVLAADDLFSFCTMQYEPEFARFAPAARAMMEHVKVTPILEDQAGQDDLLFMSSIPWVAFTSFVHPIHMHPVDSVPRITWGKWVRQGTTITMPLAVQAHHALMDGLHVGRYFEAVQQALDEAEALFHPAIKH